MKIKSITHDIYRNYINSSSMDINYIIDTDIIRVCYKLFYYPIVSIPDHGYFMILHYKYCDPVFDSMFDINEFINFVTTTEPETLKSMILLSVL